MDYVDERGCRRSASTISHRAPERTPPPPTDIEALFSRAREEIFRDGFESAFSRGLVGAVGKYGNVALKAIDRLIWAEQTDVEVASEALRCLGQIRSKQTHNNRLRLLEKSLCHPSAWARDGAGLGLAWMDDPHAIPFLKEAIQREHCIELQRDLTQVLEQLEATSASH